MSDDELATARGRIVCALVANTSGCTVTEVEAVGSGLGEAAKAGVRAAAALKAVGGMGRRLRCTLAELEAYASKLKSTKA